MHGRDYIKKAIQHQETDIVPYVFGAEPEVLQKLDAYFGGSRWKQQIKPFMHEVAWVDTQQHQKIDKIHSKDAWGAVWRMDKRPWSLVRPVMAEMDLKSIEWPAIEVFTEQVLRQVDVAREKCHKEPELYHVIGMGWGIFEISWRLRGFEDALMDAACDPDSFQGLLGKISQYYLAMVNACADIPADAFFFGDDWGDQRGLILGADRWRKLIRPAWQPIYDACRAQGKRIISHSCGSVAEIIPDLIDMGLDVLESVQPEAAGMNPYRLKQLYGQDITFFGGLGSQHLLPFGTPEEIRCEIRQLCRLMGKDGGYILAPAKFLQPETPLENALAVLEGFTRQEIL